MAKYLIVGNSAGGLGAAEAIRQWDSDGPITIVSEEPYPAYSRPLISQLLAGERTLPQILFRPPDFYKRNRLDLLLGKKVVSLDLKAKTARLSDGQALAWEKLLLATGAMPSLPALEGLGLEGVFSFNTLEDAIAIQGALERGQWATILGAGLIGVSAARALVKRGAKVTLAARSRRVLSTILDEPASEMARGALEAAGVQVITDSRGEAILGDALNARQVGSVALGNGTKIASDLVVVARGVAPRVELARDAGLEVREGILVGRSMAASHPDVYACGDAAEASDLAHDGPGLAQVWLNAYLGGRVAGFNMAGHPAAYPGGSAVNSLNLFGLAVVSAGLVMPTSECQVLSRQDEGSYQKIVLRGGRVLGMTFVGRVEKAGLIYGLMKDGVDVSSFAKDLLDKGFGLAHLPPEVRRERLSQASASLLQAAAQPGREMVAGKKAA